MIETGILLLAALLVALLSLDQTAAGQLMLSQPLVGGWLLGLALGRPLEGATAGAFLQLLCLTELPVGASIPPDGELAGLTGVALFLTLPRPPPWGDASVLGLSVLLFLPLAVLGRRAEILVRRANGIWTAAASSRLEAGRVGSAQLAAVGGVPFFFAKAFVIVFPVLWVGRLLFAAGWDGGEALPAALALLARVTPFAALGITAVSRGGRRPAAAAALGFLAGALLSWRLA